MSATSKLDPAGDHAFWIYECERNARNAAGRGLLHQADAWLAVRRTGAPPDCMQFVQKDGLTRRKRNPAYQNVDAGRGWQASASAPFARTRFTIPEAGTSRVYEMLGSAPLDVTAVVEYEAHRRRLQRARAEEAARRRAAYENQALNPGEVGVRDWQ
jgi:hypothetical protein